MTYKPLKEFNNITIIGKRWFQKTWGNSYHSVTIIVDGKQIAYKPFTYGYGDHYKQTAFEALQENNYFPKTSERLISGADKDYYDFTRYVMNNSHKILFICEDVPRKKDL